MCAIYHEGAIQRQNFLYLSNDELSGFLSHFFINQFPNQIVYGMYNAILTHRFKKSFIDKKLPKLPSVNALQILLLYKKNRLKNHK